MLNRLFPTSVLLLSVMSVLVLSACGEEASLGRTTVGRSLAALEESSEPTVPSCAVPCYDAARQTLALCLEAGRTPEECGDVVRNQTAACLAKACQSDPGAQEGEGEGTPEGGGEGEGEGAASEGEGEVTPEPTPDCTEQCAALGRQAAASCLADSGQARGRGRRCQDAAGQAEQTCRIEQCGLAPDARRPHRCVAACELQAHEQFYACRSTGGASAVCAHQANAAATTCKEGCRQPYGQCVSACQRRSHQGQRQCLSDGGEAGECSAESVEASRRCILEHCDHPGPVGLGQGDPAEEPEL